MARRRRFSYVIIPIAAAFCVGLYVVLVYTQLHYVGWSWQVGVGQLDRRRNERCMFGQANVIGFAFVALYVGGILAMLFTIWVRCLPH